MKAPCGVSGAALEGKRIEDLPPKTTSPTAPLYRRILVATDFSPASDTAFEQALQLAKQNHAALLVAHVWVIPATLGFMPVESYDAWERDFHAEAEANLGKLVARARRENVKAHRLALTGLADGAIVGVAKRLDVDLIVIGASSHPKWARLIAGSCVEGVVSHAPCAALVAVAA